MYGQLDVQQLTEQQGLGNNTINEIHQDHKGFLWIGTDIGITRYDGNFFHTYNLLRPGGGEPISVSKIQETENKYLWLSDKEGTILCFDKLKEKYIPMYIFAALTLLVKEDAAVYILLFALFVIISRKKYLHGAILAVGAALYFSCALAILNELAAHYAELYAGDTPNPSIAGPMINRFDNLIANSEDGLLGAVMTALKNPGYLLEQLFSTRGAGLDSFFAERSPWAKVVYLLQMLLPVGFIPFCTKKQSRWLLVAPILLNVLTTYKYQYSVNFQYHFGITAFLMYAMILNLPDLQPVSRRRLLAFGAAAGGCMYIFTVMPRYHSYTDRWEANKETYQSIEAMLDTLPEDASLCVPSSYLAHVADRREIYEHTYHAPDRSHIKEDDVEYVVLRLTQDNKYRKIFEACGYTVWAEYADHLILQKPGME